MGGKPLRYYLGPDLSAGLLNIYRPVRGLLDAVRGDPVGSGMLAAESVGPQADIKGMVDSSQSAMGNFRQGNILGGLLDTAYIPANMATLLLPGSASGYRKAGEAVGDAVKKADDLPMDEASRMARAREMGFDMDRPLYRGTTEKGATKALPSFEAGDGVFLNDNPDVAEIFRYPREYGEVLTEYYDEAADEFMPIEPGDLQTLYARMQNPLRLTGDEAQRFTHDTALQSKTIREARAAGHDSIIVENVMEGVGDWQERGTTVVALKPVRAKDAKFDPKKKDSANILAGVGGAGLLGAGILDQYRQEKDRGLLY